MKSKTRTIKHKFILLFIFTTLMGLSLILAACQPTPTATENPATPLPPTDAAPTEAPPPEPETEPAEEAPEISQPIARWREILC